MKAKATASPAPKPAPAEEKKTETAPVITQSETEQVQAPVIFSELNKATVPGALIPHLDSVANILNKYPDMQEAIVGHTCDIGTEKENEIVAMGRAKAVAAFLHERGVAEGRITTSSAGAAQPIVPNTSAHNRSINRRVTAGTLAF